MKLGMVILSGAADLPHPALGGETPLTAARMPALAKLVEAGRVGGVLTVPRGDTPSTESALATLLGRDPARGRPGAGPLLAASIGEPVGPDEVAFRCDLVNLFEGSVFDPTAGAIAEREAKPLLEALGKEFEADGIGAAGIRLRYGDRWRMLLVADRGRVAEDVRTLSPASVVSEPGRSRRVKGRGGKFLTSVMERAERLLEEHEINTVRADLGENPANGLWIWGPGRPTAPDPAPEGGAAAVGRHPSFLGMAKCVGFRPGEPVADAEAAGAAALEALERADLVVVHVEEPLDLSRRGDVKGKVEALTAADRAVIAPLAERLGGDEGRLLVVASHVASSDRRKDLAGVVPFVVAGRGMTSYGEVPFSEAGAEQADLTVEHGHELLGFAARP